MTNNSKHNPKFSSNQNKKEKTKKTEKTEKNEKELAQLQKDAFKTKKSSYLNNFKDKTKTLNQAKIITQLNKLKKGNFDYKRREIIRIIANSLTRKMLSLPNTKNVTANYAASLGQNSLMSLIDKTKVDDRAAPFVKSAIKHLYTNFITPEIVKLNSNDTAEENKKETALNIYDSTKKKISNSMYDMSEEQLTIGIRATLYRFFSDHNFILNKIIENVSKKSGTSIIHSIKNRNKPSNLEQLTILEQIKDTINSMIDNIKQIDLESMFSSAFDVLTGTLIVNPLGSILGTAFMAYYGPVLAKKLNEHTKQFVKANKLD